MRARVFVRLVSRLLPLKGLAPINLLRAGGARWLFHRITVGLIPANAFAFAVD